MDPLIALIVSGLNYGMQFWQNQENKTRIEEANEKEKANWDKENAYNDVSAQAQRLRNAGFNPRAFIQNVPAGTIHSFQPDTPEAPQFDISQYLEARSTESQNEFNRLKAEYMDNEDLRQAIRLLQEQEYKDLLKEQLKYNNKITKHDVELYLESKIPSKERGKIGEIMAWLERLGNWTKKVYDPERDVFDQKEEQSWDFYYEKY